MSARAAIIGLALAAASPAVGQIRIELTDENVARLGSGDLLLWNAVNHALFFDAGIQGELDRAGIERGCLIINTARRQAIETHRPAFTPHLVAAMRAVVPEERLQTSTSLGLGGFASYRTRITAEIERTAAPVLAQATADARTAAATGLASATAVPVNEAAGRFSDWRLDTPMSKQVACDLVEYSRNRTAEEFARLKSTFDGFYRRSGE